MVRSFLNADSMGRVVAVVVVGGGWGGGVFQSMPNHKDGSAAFSLRKLNYDKFHWRGGGTGMNAAVLGVLLCMVVC